MYLMGLWLIYDDQKLFEGKINLPGQSTWQLLQTSSATYILTHIYNFLQDKNIAANLWVEKRHVQLVVL